MTQDYADHRSVITEDLGEKVTQLSITILIPKTAYEKLYEYGYDFCTNLEEELKHIYWELLKAEEELKHIYWELLKAEKEEADN